MAKDPEEERASGMVDGMALCEEMIRGMAGKVPGDCCRLLLTSTADALVEARGIALGDMARHAMKYRKATRY